MTRPRSDFHFRLALVTPLIALTPALAQPDQHSQLRQQSRAPRVIEASIETPLGTIYKVSSARTALLLGGPPSFSGDTFDFQHQLGRFTSGSTAECFAVHMAGMQDNTVLFDGLTEELDAYVDGTQPLVFEFETPTRGAEADVFINSFSDTGTDLFPEGFEDPNTGDPLDAACVEIGIDDTLDPDLPADVTSAMIELSDDSGPILPSTDITSFFSSPFDGRLSIVFSGFTGLDINGIVLDLQIEQPQQSIFADGFESGDATAWTSDR